MAAFLIIGCVWMTVIGGAALKIRAERLESIDSFQRQLRAFAGGLPPLDAGGPSGPSEREIRGTLGPAAGDGFLPPALDAAELLRHILAALLVTVVCSFLYALAVGSRWAWGLHLLVDNALLAYVALLVQRRDRLASDGRPAAARTSDRSGFVLPRTIPRERVPVGLT